MREELLRDAERMEDIMCRSANSDSNGWQYVYWIAVAVYHIITYLLRRELNGKTNDQEENRDS